MDSAQDLFKPVPTPEEFQVPVGDRFFVDQDGTRALLSSEEGVQVSFFEDSVKLELASKEAGLPLHKTQTFVRIKCKYDPQNIHVHPVRDVEDDEWKIRFKHEWQLYLKAREHAAQGAAIMGWDEIQPHQKATLVAIGITTLEKLVVAEDDLLKKVFDKPKQIKEAALAQLNYKNRVAEITEVTKKLVETKSDLESANEIIDRLQAEKSTLQSALNAVKGKKVSTQDVQARRFLKKQEEVKDSLADFAPEAEVQEKKEGEI
jgi:hypothetical protein